MCLDKKSDDKHIQKHRPPLFLRAIQGKGFWTFNYKYDKFNKLKNIDLPDILD